MKTVPFFFIFFLIFIFFFFRGANGCPVGNRLVPLLASDPLLTSIVALGAGVPRAASVSVRLSRQIANHHRVTS